MSAPSHSLLVSIMGSILGLLITVSGTVRAATFIPMSTTPADSPGDIEYVEHFGLFAGTTDKGFFAMPYQIFAPANPSEGNGVVVVEPPHFAYSSGLGRDVFLGRELLFSRGFSHASVGFSELLFNILAPIPGLWIAGGPAVQCDPALDVCTAERDVEIIKQFSEALASDPWAVSALGPLTGRYAFGSSQTTVVLSEMIYDLGIEGLYDFILMTLAVWRLDDEVPQTETPPGALPDDFVPVDDIGKVIIVNAEGDQLFSEAEKVRAAAGHPDYRLYEVAGTPHFASIYLPPSFPGYEYLNPLDSAPVARAAFIAGHRWVTEGAEPPANAVLAGAAPGEIDFVYGFETGIARDADGNAAGGVQLPEIAVGQGHYVAWTDAPSLPLPGGIFAPLLGLYEDLTCEPPAGSGDERPRFRNHGSYVSAYAKQANLLVRQGYLLPDEAESMVDAAAESEIGKPRSCD